MKTQTRQSLFYERTLLVSMPVLIAIILLMSFLAFAMIPEIPPTDCDNLFCINDVYNTNGNPTLKICTGTGNTVNGFNIWYNGTGPFNLTGHYRITSATYTNGTEYYDSLGLNNHTGWGCVIFVLNGTQASFTNQTTEVNVTIFNNTDYALASQQCSSQLQGCNGTMITANYVVIESRDFYGNPLPNTLIMTYDNYTKSFISQGPAMTDSAGYFAEHCSGIVKQGACINTTPMYMPNICRVHGTPFPSPQGSPPDRHCVINSSVTIFGFDFISSNTTSLLNNVTPGSPLYIVIDNPSSVGFVTPFSYSPQPGPPQFVDLSALTVREYDTNELVYVYTSSGSSQQGDPHEKGPPFFISANKIYILNMSIKNSSSFSYPFVSPSVGMTGADIIIPNSTLEYTTFVGKVVNESGEPVDNAVVYVQFFKSGGSGFGINFFNSSITDAYGRFSVSVPRTEFVSQGSQQSIPYPVYQFYIISNKTNENGIPIYFPTIDNNKNRGYFAHGERTILSPLVLKAGGKINVNVTLHGSALIISELSKVMQLGTGLLRAAVTGRMNMISIFPDVTPPANILVSLLAPTSDTYIFYNLIGRNQSMESPDSGPLIGVCFNSTTISQGGITQSSCSLSTPGYLNLTATFYQDIFSYSGDQPMTVSNFEFWFDNNLIIRNSAGDVVLYLSPEGSLLQNLLGFGNSPYDNLTIPLPPGTYTLEIAPGFDEFSRYLAYRDVTPFDIYSGNTINVDIPVSNAWNIEPMFPTSLVLSDNNTLYVSVSQQNSPLNDSYVTVTGKILFLNKSEASDQTIDFSFDPYGPVGGAFNTTFQPSDLGLSAGKYWLMINATHTDTNKTYTTTRTFPVNIYDFVIGVDFPGFAFGRGQSVIAKMFAFNSTGPVESNTSAVIIEITDENGNSVDMQASSSGISNGEGTINITMPDTVGFYELMVKVNASGKYGVASIWFQVSDFNIKISTERQKYQPNDNVVVNVRLYNSTTNSPLSDASVEVVVDNSDTPAIGTTNSDGEASVTLNPAICTNMGQWSYGHHNIKVKISKETGTDVIKLETYTWFEVRGMEAFIIPDKPSYEQSDNVVINIFLPPDVDVQSITATLDGNQSDVQQGTIVDPHFWHIELGQRQIGHHDVEVTITDTLGNSQSFYVGFDVNSYIIKADTDKWIYAQGEDVGVNIEVSYPNGTAVDGAGVMATLFKAQPPNDINVSFNSTVLSNGTAHLTLNASKSGFNYIEVSVNNQKKYIGIQVSSINVTLTDSSGNPVTNYNTVPGNYVTIYVNAVSGSSPVPDGSIVTGKLWAFGSPQELPSNTTVSGNATITFQMPPGSPSQVYGLEIIVTAPSGSQGFAPPSTLTVSGGDAPVLDVMSDRFSYSSGDTANLIAFLTYSNGTGISGRNITFEIGSEGGKTQLVGVSQTDSSGKATVQFDITMNQTDGEYFIHAYLSDNPDVQHYSGFMISSLDVRVAALKDFYSPGENLTLSVTVINRTSGSALNATRAFVYIFTPKGEIRHTYDPTGHMQPYMINISIPNEQDVIGSYPIEVVMFVNRSKGSGMTLVDVRNATLSLNMSLPESITEGQSFVINISSSLNGTASLVVFSPEAHAVAYENNSIPIINNSASLNLTLNNSGVFIFRLFVPGIGAETEVKIVSASGTAPSVWAGTSTSSATKTFADSQDVYIMTNIANATATVITLDQTTNSTVTFSLPLNQKSGNSYYGILDNQNTISGNTYFIRLDTSTASAVATSIFMVS